MLDHQHFNEGIITAAHILDRFPPIRIHNLQSPILSPQVYQIGPERRGDNGADHGIILDNLLQENSLHPVHAVQVCTPHYLPNVQGVVLEAARY